MAQEWGRNHTNPQVAEEGGEGGNCTTTVKFGASEGAEDTAKALATGMKHRWQAEDRAEERERKVGLR